MPQAKANPICRVTSVLTFSADSFNQNSVKRTLLFLIAGLLFAVGSFAAKPPNVVLINGNWKVILPYKANLTTRDEAKGTGKTELYNLAKDPFERQNLAKSKASRVKRLTKQLNTLLPES
tara:strand:+ start:335 stop:694 length:360 start_codon:yes stop_codon:yes gene_type:complete